MGEIVYNTPKLPVNAVRLTDELEIYRRVNETDSMQELALVVQQIGDEDGMVMGKAQKWGVAEQAGYMMAYSRGHCAANVVTRSYGLRQQMMYLRYYGKY